MRKLIILFSIVMLFVAVPAMAFDMSKSVGLSEKTLVVDGEFIGGKTFESTYDVNNDIETATLTSKQHEWLIQATVGLKVYDTVRGFWEYETVTGMYSETTLGTDIMFPMAGLDAGVRIAHVSRKDYKVSDSDYWFSGVRLRF